MSQTSFSSLIRGFLLLFVVMLLAHGRILAGQANQACMTVEVHGPSEATATEPIHYKAKIKNAPRGQQIRLTWSVEGGAIVDGQGTAELTVKPDSHVVKVTAAIENPVAGCTPGTGSAQTQVRGNLPPSIVSITPSQSQITLACPPGMTSTSCPSAASLSLQLEAVATDPDNDQLLYTWSTTGGRISGEGKMVTWDLSGAAPGTYTVLVLIDDGNSHRASGSTTVIIAGCPDCRTPPPQCPTLSVSAADSIDAGSPATFTAGIDFGSNVSYNWTVSAGTITSGQGTSSITVATNGLKGQTITATVELGAVNPSCARSASATIQVLSGITPDDTLVTGAVRDESGKVLSGALVTAKRGNETKSVLTRQDGSYVLPLLTGNYSVTVTLSGYRPANQTVDLKDPGDQKVRDFTLKRSN